MIKSPILGCPEILSGALIHCFAMALRRKRLRPMTPRFCQAQHQRKVLKISECLLDLAIQNRRRRYGHDSSESGPHTHTHAICVARRATLKTAQ
jgi:hypothetical protein